MKRLLIVGYFIFYISVYFSLCQSNEGVQSQYKFKHLSVDQGLSNNNVWSICQDSRGFIWLATKNGLNKFNGQSIVTYRHSPQDSTSISSNELNVVFLDSKNQLWIGSSMGLDMYNPDLNNFTHFKHNSIDWDIDDIYTVTEDKNSQLWFGGKTGLYRYNLKTSELKYFSNQINNSIGIPPNIIYRLLVDKKNRLWISVQNEGLCLYDQLTDKLTCFRNSQKDKSTISGNRIERLYEDSRGDIWVGTMNNGLNLFNPENNTFTRINPDLTNSYSSRVRAIFEDFKGNFFIGTRGGMYIRDNLTNTFSLYAHEGHNFSNLSQNSITSNFIDKTGTLWIGTFSGGVNYTNLNKKEFIHYRAGKNDNHFLNGSNIYAITEDMNGNLWIGGDNGLNYLDKFSHTFKYYSNIPDNPNSLSYNDVKALEYDNKGNLWIGTNKGGLCYYNTNTNQFNSYRHEPNNPNSLAGDKIYGLLNDKQNNLWILSTPYNNFEYFNIDILPNGANKFTHLKEQAYLGLDKDENGNIYIGGINGFWIFSSKDSIFSFVLNDTLINKVNAIKKDSKGNIWVGSAKGLVRYNVQHKSFSRYSEDNGFPISEVYGILEDRSKNLWVSTNLGLVKISNIVNDINQIKFRIYDQFDGLQSKQFNYNAYYKCKSGKMVFGGINGFNSFNPDEIIENNAPADIKLTDLKIFDNSTPIGTKLGGRIILEKSITLTDEITLGRKQNVFSLEFASLQNTNPEKEIFKFKLEGFDKDWQYRKAGNNYVTYTNLKAGKYIFYVTAANSDGVWNKEGVSLKITILPPWWKTIWFRLLSILIVIGSFLGFYYYRLNNLHKQRELLTKLVHERTLEIENKNNLLQKQADDLNDINASLEERQQKVEEQAEELRAQADELALQNNALGMLNATKDKFFSIIAHDLKNPFTSILGFCEILLSRFDTYDNTKKKHLIKSIYKSSNNIYKLLENLLQWSRSQTGTIKNNPEEFLLLELAQNIKALTTNSLQEKDMKLVLSIPKDFKIIADKNMINTVIRNLVTNAIKFSEGGDIKIEVNDSNETTKVCVIDQGVGISDLVLDKIFDIEQSKSTIGTRGESGTGLGLIICKDFIEKHNGTISVESKLGIGSTFCFTIPKIVD